ncbi:MAG TPA: hypothetical protein VK961_13315 [Chthoniobacter sp.]|nr:hypothetical protein [Chthoniobacter sp.]
MASFAITLSLSIAASLAVDRPSAAKLPKGHIVAEDSHSPDQRYAVTVFNNSAMEEPPAGADANRVIELKTGRVVAVLPGEPGLVRMNHGDLMPARWSADSSVLLWEVAGKWFHDAMVLVRLDQGKLLWQRDVLKLLQQEILTRTRTLNPKTYARVKKDHIGWGSAYPEGFCVEVEALNPIAFPLRVRARLASETKVESILDTHLEGEINAKGELKITKFASGPGPVQRNF